MNIKWNNLFGYSNHALILLLDQNKLIIINRLNYKQINNNRVIKPWKG